MIENDKMAMAALERAEPMIEHKLAAALARHGVTSPDQLPREIAAQILREAFVQTAVEHFPEAQIDALHHGLSAFAHPLFSPAFSRLQAEAKKPSDAFAVATGVDAAVVLAAFGLPVAPFDRKRPTILADPTNDIDEVAKVFSKWKTAYVGYSPCDVPFYILLTDCVRTMLPQIAIRPELREAKYVIERTPPDLPVGPFPAFRHGLLLLPREPADTVSTVYLGNPNPHQGSVALYAGWRLGEMREGAPNNGFLPVPLQFLWAALQDPQIAMWVWKPVGARLTLN